MRTHAIIALFITAPFYHSLFLILDDVATMPTPCNLSNYNLNNKLALFNTQKPLFIPFSLKSIQLILLTVFAGLIPLFSQAALPNSIQTALTRAALTPNDISIIVTPVGDKNSSHLPPIIKGVDRRAILQREYELNAYTDDPYTHLSLTSAPNVQPIMAQIKTAQEPKPASTPSVSLISHQPDIARTPASTMKLIPSFVALDTLGADFVWFTRVYHTGLIVGDRLHGDLIIQGSGDPKMTHLRLQELLSKVQQAGIRHIDGDIVIDSTVFENVSKNPAAFDNSPLRPYNASPDGFLVNFNTIGIQSKPPINGQSQLSYSPQLANYQLPRLIGTRSANCSYARRSLAPTWQKQGLIFNAKLPSSCNQHLFYVGYPDAKDFAARVITTQWQALGGTISGEALAQETPYKPYNYYKTPHYKASFDKKGLDKISFDKTSLPAQPAYGLTALSVSPLPIVSYPSLNLAQQIYDINHFSNNVMTEQVALSIGAYHHPNSSTDNSQTNTAAKIINAASLYQFGKPSASDYPKALQAIRQWWQSNLTTPAPYLTNGSGLCRDCSVSAANLDELLTYAYHHPSFSAYVNSLGIAGVNGTIVYHSERLPNSAAIGRAWIKTGTLNNVTAMAGYVKGQSGQDYTVVGLINTEQALNPYIARPVLDAVLDWTAKQ